MKKFASVLAVTAAIALIAFSFGSDNGKFGPRLTARLETNSPDAFVVWVFFSDKGPDSRLRLSDPSALLTQRSLERRLKVKPPSEVIDISDVPVFEPYVASVSGKVLRVRNRSRWFNAVSVELNRAQLGDIASLGFVSQIELVETYIKVNEDRCGDEENSVQQPDYNPLADTFNYGNSFNQINQIKVNLVHNQGIFGQGVMIASFDNGWRNQTHEAFTTLPMKVVSQYDFQLGRPGANNIGATTSHGTQTLSNVGGYMPGKLIAPSFRSAFIVARTEVDSFERPIEMDNWMAATEWADSLGADVITSSVGYLGFDAGYTSYTWTDMNGNNLLVTRAADLAVNKGIIVCNSAGNSGNNPSHNTLIGPADGDSVFTIGAVTSAGLRASFSSVGPTTDVPPRIKPDLMAMGSGNYIATLGSNTAYSTGSGTSFSCPLAAGVCGLVLSANRSLTPMQVRGILRKFASNSSSPNNLMGWGIIDASLSVDSARKLDNSPPVIAHTQPFTSTSDSAAITMKSKITDNGIIRKWTNEAPRLYFRKSTNGGSNWTAFSPVSYNYTNLDSFFFPIPGSPAGTVVQYYFAAQDIALPSPNMATLPAGGSGINPPGTTPPSTRFQYTVTMTGIRPLSGEIPDKFMLYNNYPNPFNPVTRIRFDLPSSLKLEARNLRLVIFDAMGREIAVPVNGQLKPGRYEIDWNASGFASGVYFYRLTAGDFTGIKKMVLLK